MAPPRAHINPEVLRWARTSAGYSAQDAAKKLQVKPERYEAWETPDSDVFPTFNQLRRIGGLFRRPISVFYLAAPPEGFQAMRDFRRLPGFGLPHYSPALLYEMELAQQRRELAVELYEDIGEEIDAFPLSATLRDNPEEVGQTIRQFLGVTFSEQRHWRSGDPLGPFKAWRSAIEAKDILVFQMSRVERDEVSGFAVAHNTLPVIAVNRKDFPNRRAFSLLHELVHLILHQSGASDLDVDAARPPEEQQVEVFCNRAAAAALMPKEHFLSQPDVQARGARNEGWSDDEIGRLAGYFGVSRIAIVRRLLTHDRTTEQFYRAKQRQFDQEYREALERRKDSFSRSDKEFRRNPPRDAILELGHPYVRLVLDGIRQNIVTLNEASSYLGNLRIKHFSKLEQTAYTG